MRKLGVARRSPWRWLLAVAAVVTAAAHVPVIAPHLDEAPYMGGLFIVLTAACLFLAVAALTRDNTLIYGLAVLTCGLSVIGYLATRSVAFPQLSDDVGNWFEPLGVAEVALAAGDGEAGCRGCGLPSGVVDTPAVGRSDDDPDHHRAHVVPAAGPAGLAGAEVRTPDETVLGLVGGVVEVDRGDGGTGGTRWVSVVTGDDGGAEATVVVPLANTVTEDDVVRLPFGGQTILGAPRPADPESITAHEHADLESYYGAFTSTDRDVGWVMPQDLPDVPFILEETLRDATTPED